MKHSFRRPWGLLVIHYRVLTTTSPVGSIDEAVFARDSSDTHDADGLNWLSCHFGLLSRYDCERIVSRKIRTGKQLPVVVAPRIFVALSLFVVGPQLLVVALRLLVIELRLLVIALRHPIEVVPVRLATRAEERSVIDVAYPADRAGSCHIVRSPPLFALSSRGVLHPTNLISRRNSLVFHHSAWRCAFFRVVGTVDRVRFGTRVP